VVKGANKMIDLYYTDLARFSLNKAIENLQTAQNHIIRAELYQADFERVQRAINAVRREIDYIGRVAKQAKEMEKTK
jgi:hypothetical protein